MRIKDYTAKEIHAALIAKNFLLLDKLIEERKKEYKEVPDVVESNLNHLRTLGLINTKNAELLKNEVEKVDKENEAIRKFNEHIDYTRRQIEFIKETRKLFGDDVLLVSYADFEYIIKKYKLVCGLLEQYTGVIPQKNVEELVKAKDIIDKNYFNYSKKYLKNLYYIASTSAEIKDEDKFRIFPFCYIIEDRDSEEARFCFYGVKRSYYIIANGGTCEKHFLELVNKNNPTDLFIAAPKKDMNTSVSFLESLMPKPQDPFICSYTEYGILIYTKWGEEAEDEVLDKYYKKLKLIQ